ncbi:hypothetical protein COU20_01625 [Candidatus Kaiserbacteria bacterium CG10_big_fil_rev_8_21_14_0_10_59_10]|uniref:Uncharacterized protein n=1 Tax=Candidatus Kaiserbacteria bacterium CG10_big_fil_rev_8_21_14_0_10_59_10 TaxID=1974612 RepID=A0A2H0U833_9BACT|nr:MAG: hypothetical protein COU20_01625 [Candidatus Kaiserbacteria bacterium CG10_big_fil_rev_8_21_14_0_10_59_10]
MRKQVSVVAAAVATFLATATVAVGQPIHCGGYAGEGCMHPQAREQLYRSWEPRQFRGAHALPPAAHGFAPRPLYGYGGYGHRKKKPRRRPPAYLLVPRGQIIVPRATCVRRRSDGFTVCAPAY